MEIVAWVALVLGMLNALAVLIVLRELAVLRMGGVDRSGLRIDSELPQFTAPALDGSTFTGEQSWGKLLLLLSSTCALCRQIVDELKAMPPHQRPPLVIGVSSHHSVNVTDPFIAKLDFVDPGSVFLDHERRVFRTIAAPVTPWVYAVTANGRVRGSGAPVGADELREMSHVLR